MELNKQFVAETQKLQVFLTETKRIFDCFDKNNPSEQEQIKLIENNKKLIFKEFDEHFQKTSKIAESFSKPEYAEHKAYYYGALSSFLILAPVNRHIYEKPLGYAGDFITMNYLYDNKYEGDSTFAKLIHHYTCNIPVAIANRNRRFYFKAKFKDLTKNTAGPIKITSVGCGPAKELIEFISDDDSSSRFHFVCLDIEPMALKQVEANVQLIEKKSGKAVKIDLIHADILTMIKGKKTDELLFNNNLVYSAGLIDYMSDRISQRLLANFYNFIQDDGSLIVGNVSKEDKSVAYYEMLGEWYLNRRSREDLIALAKDINTAKRIYVEDEPQTSMNHFLIIEK